MKAAWYDRNGSAREVLHTGSSGEDVTGPGHRQRKKGEHDREDLRPARARGQHQLLMCAEQQRRIHRIAPNSDSRVTGSQNVGVPPGRVAITPEFIGVAKLAHRK